MVAQPLYFSSYSAFECVCGSVYGSQIEGPDSTAQNSDIAYYHFVFDLWLKIRVPEMRLNQHI